MTFRFLAPAQAELFEAITYYSEINAELGVRFEQAVANSVRAAATHPERGAPRSRNTRRWLVGEDIVYNKADLPCGTKCAIRDM